MSVGFCLHFIECASGIAHSNSLSDSFFLSLCFLKHARVRAHARTSKHSCSSLPSASLLMLIFPDGFYVSADPNPVLTHRNSGVFGDFRVLGKSSTPPVCDYTECAGIYHEPCPSLPSFMCSTLVLEKNNANQWPPGTSFSLILHDVKLRRSAVNFGILQLSTISSNSQGNTVLHDTGQVNLLMNPGNLGLSQFQMTSVFSASLTSMVAEFTVDNTLKSDDGIEISLPPEYILPFGYLNATHLASGNEYAMVESRVPIIYVDRGVLVKGSTGNVTLRPALISTTSSVQFSLNGIRTASVSGRAGLFQITTVDLYNLVVDAVKFDGAYVEYEAPNVVQLIASNVPKIGSVSITVSGNNFGYFDYNPAINGMSIQRQVTVGKTTCFQTSWVAHTSLVCSIDAGFGVGNDVLFIIEGKEGQKKVSFSYDYHSLRYVSLTNRGFTDRIITTVGKNFGTLDLSAVLRAHFSSCELSNWNSDSSLMCRTTHHKDMSMSIVVSIQANIQSVSNVLSCDSHIVRTDAFSNRGSTGDSALITATTALVRTAVSGVGSHDRSVRAGMGGSGSEATGWQSDSSLQCRWSMGSGSTWSLMVTASGGASSISEGFSYSGTGVAPETGRVNVMVPGGAAGMIVPAGSGIGRAQLTAVGRFGGTSSQASKWISTTALACVVSGGTQGSVSVAVTGGGLRGSASQAVSYDGMTTSGLAQSNVPSGRGPRVEVRGGGMGPTMGSMGARWGRTTVEATEWQSDSSVTCLESARRTEGQSSSVVVTAGASTGSLSGAGSYDSGSLLFNRYISVNEPSGGLIELDIRRWVGVGIHGVLPYFGSIQGNIQSTSFEASRWVSESRVECRWAMGSGFTSGLVITASSSSNSLSEGFSYSGLSLAPRRSESNLMVLGGSWSGSGGSGIMCVSSSWVDSYGDGCSAYERKPALCGFQQSSSECCGCGGGKQQRKSIMVINLITGKGVGRGHITAQARLSSSSSQGSLWISTSAISCAVSGGVGRTLTLSLTAGAIQGSRTETVSYDLTNLKHEYFAKTNVRPSESNTHVVIGQIGIGMKDPSSIARWGRTTVEATEWQSDSSVTCLVSARRTEGQSSSVVVTAGASTGSLSGAGSYDVGVVS